MSGKNRLLSVIRRQHYYKIMLKTLDELEIEDWEIVPPTGKGHPILTFTSFASKVRIPLPTTPQGGLASKYIPVEIRRRVREASVTPAAIDMRRKLTQ